MGLPVVMLTEGKKLGQFWTLVKTHPILLPQLLASGLWFALSTELSAPITKRASAVTMSVAGTAMRATSMIAVALVLKESLGFVKLFGSIVTFGGAFLYSIIDDLVEAREER